jgi:hypothetical protein
LGQLITFEELGRNQRVQRTGFNNNVESVFVIFLDLVELNLWVITGKFNVDLIHAVRRRSSNLNIETHISSIELLRELHLQTLGCSKNDLATSVLTEHW